MKLSVVQFAPVLGDKKVNTQKIIDFIDKIDSDIIIFPELATTGYFFESKEETAPLADEMGQGDIAVFQQMATDQDKIIVVGFIEKAGTKIFNSAALLFPDSDLSACYRKTHLFYKERFCFDEGDTGYFVVRDENRDINIGTMICYDWRFPEAARSLGIAGADLIVCPSNLVTDVWHIAMPARALENKVYLAVANRFGTEIRNEESLLFLGRSAIHKYNGSLMEQAPADKETVITTEISPAETRNKSFNEFNDIFKDRRPELYIR